MDFSEHAKAAPGSPRPKNKRDAKACFSAEIKAGLRTMRDDPPEAVKLDAGNSYGWRFALDMAIWMIDRIEKENTDGDR